MDATEGFAAFVAIVETGSVSAAARRLGMPRPTLSRQLSRLETRLGVRLLHRSTRRLVPTAAGDALFPRAQRLVAEADAAIEAVRRHDDVPRGLLRVSVPPVAGPWFADLIVSFLGRWPEVQVEVVADARHVDLVREGFDVAIRGGVVRDPSLVARRLLRAESVVVASPAYVAARGAPRTPEELVQHEAILAPGEGGRGETHWACFGGGAAPVRGRLVTNDIFLRLGAARDGLGLALLPRLMIAEELARGELVPVLEGQVGFDGVLAVVHVERAFVDPKVRAFVDHVVAAAEAGRLIPPR